MSKRHNIAYDRILSDQLVSPGNKLNTDQMIYNNLQNYIKLKKKTKTK